MSAEELQATPGINRPWDAFMNFVFSTTSNRTDSCLAAMVKSHIVTNVTIIR